ncbi:hypothetical protein AB0M36_01725 [Actinoplanes sp. NPDC051346]|uniref:hypothetical protein n=1 Tax=Actinoplanes sp. NPDC051346 TaxID=3155048 RepID=UPI00344514A5
MNWLGHLSGFALVEDVSVPALPLGAVHSHVGVVRGNAFQQVDTGGDGDAETRGDRDGDRPVVGADLDGLGDGGGDCSAMLVSRVRPRGMMAANSSPVSREACPP